MVTLSPSQNDDSATSAVNIVTTVKKEEKGILWVKILTNNDTVTGKGVLSAYEGVGNDSSECIQ